MKGLSDWLSVKPGIFFLLILLMLPFAFLLNIDLMPLISDEPTRAIVTLEMILSGNYITPTINGEFYYNKPPLFNWLLAGFTFITGRENEFTFRIPTVISLMLMGLAIYRFSLKSLGKYQALIAGLMWITSARILFWDSFQGLIDITYSLVTFTSFTLLYHLSQKQRWLALFVSTYLLTAAGYLMKGLPSIAFQGISLLVWLSYDKNFRKLMSWQHLAGIFAFLLVTGVYYFAYLQSNTLQDVFSTLFDQSNRLNDKGGTITSWILHLFTFPLEMSYEFAPWTLIAILLLFRPLRKALFNDKLITFSALMFISNIVIYWVSADMRPRYLFMLFPLLFIILNKAWMVASEHTPKVRNIISMIFQVLMYAGALSLLVYLFWDETRHLSGVWPVVIVLFLLSSFVAILGLYMKNQRLMLLIIIMLAVRIGFNAFNLPARYNSYPDAGYRSGEIAAGKIIGQTPAFVLGDTPFNHDASFYISRESRQIIKRTHEISDKAAYYITDAKNLANFAGGPENYVVLHTFTIKLLETELFLIKLNL